MSVYSEVVQHNPGAVIDLIDIMIEDRSGNSLDNLYFTSSQEFSGGIYSTFTWQGNTYTVTALRTTGLSFDINGPASQPTLQISNQDTVILGFINLYNDLRGVRVIRWRTTKSMIDNQAQPYIAKNEYIISQLMEFSPKEIKFKLISSMDRDRAKIPFRQVLRDKYNHAGEEYQFPGVARDGSRRR